MKTNILKFVSASSSILSKVISRDLRLNACPIYYHTLNLSNNKKYMENANCFNHKILLPL